MTKSGVKFLNISKPIIERPHTFAKHLWAERLLLCLIQSNSKNILMGSQQGRGYGSVLQLWSSCYRTCRRKGELTRHSAPGGKLCIHCKAAKLWFPVGMCGNYGDLGSTPCAVGRKGVLGFSSAQHLVRTLCRCSMLLMLQQQQNMQIYTS